MFHKFIETIRHINDTPSGFEVYFSHVQRPDRPGAPNASEAKRDYQRFAKRDITYYIP